MNIFKSNLKILFMVIFCMALQTQVFAQVKASLNQKSYYQGDIITLKIETDRNQKEDPDLSALTKNFEIKGSSASSQINILNGTRKYRKIWNIELQAKAVGQFIIPGIPVGAEKTEAVEIKVVELPPEVAAETNKHIFIESEVDLGTNNDNEIYVQQQIPYTIKFFYDAAMQTGEVVLPVIENSNIRALGNEKKYQVVRAGNKYVVVERRYVISPEKSGKLVIPPTKVQGRIALTGGDSPQLRRRMNEVDMLNELFNDFNNRTTFANPFDPFFSSRSIGPTRPFTVSSESTEVNVLPVPESFTGAAWLPAEEVKMQDSWAANPPILKVGEPVSRNITMQVKGLASSQIPKIEIPKPEGMKIYPEQAKSETPNDGNTIYGIQRVDISYIPDKSGAVTIPEINVDWWDVNNKEQRTYTLPGWNLNVAAGAIKSNEGIVEPQPVMESSIQPNLPKENELTAATSSWSWQLILSVLALIVGVLLLFAYLYNRFKDSPSRVLKHIKRQRLNDINALYVSLLDACKTNDNKAAADLLLKYTKLKFPKLRQNNLGALAQKVSHGSDVVKQLEASLYAADSQKWQGDSLYKLLSQGLQTTSKEQGSEISGLAPLYPS